jgi:excisionase family DNA binding protein
MSDLLSSVAFPSPAPADPAATALRASLIGNRHSYQQIAEALRCTERAVYMLVDRCRIPYIRVLGKRYVDSNDILQALLRDQANSPPRSRGRPRKNAA